MMCLFFCLVVVVKTLLYTTTSQALFDGLGFVVWVCFGVRFGCASCHKQHLVNLKRKKARPSKVYMNPKKPSQTLQHPNFLFLLKVQGLAALRIRSVIMLCCSGVNNSSSHLGHRSTLTFFRIMSSYSKSTSISVNSTQHLGHIKAPAFTISSCWLSGLFVTLAHGIQ